MRVANDDNARRLICSRVGGGAFERFGTASTPDDKASGAPQPMHADALVLTARPHSLQVIKAMMSLLPHVPQQHFKPMVGI